MTTQVCQYATIPDFIGGRMMEMVVIDWSYGMCKAPMKLSPPTYHTNTEHFTGRIPSCCSANSIRAVKGESIILLGLVHPKLAWGLPSLYWSLKAPGYLGRCQASCQPSDTRMPCLVSNWNTHISSFFLFDWMTLKVYYVLLPSMNAITWSLK